MSKAAFVAANSFTFLVMAIVVCVFALVIPLFAPGPDGTQLRPLRAWHSWCANADPELARCVYRAPDGVLQCVVVVSGRGRAKGATEMIERHIWGRSGWDLRLRWAAVFFVVALAVHTADHLRRGMDVVAPAVMTAGMIQGVAAAITVVLVFRGGGWAPHAAILVGFASAVGFIAAHLLPTWGAFSDSFIDAAPAAGVTWFSWVTAILEILADLLFGAAGVAVLAARSTPR